jgi:hypothetical protein
MCRAEDLHLQALRVLGPEIVPDIAEDTDTTLTADSLAELKACVGEMAELYSRVVQLAEGLPEEAVAVDYEAVRSGAAEDLSEGIIDPHRAELAACILDVSRGWPALAHGLSEDVAQAWSDMSLGEVLGRFRGASELLVSSTLSVAGFAPETTFGAMSPANLLRLGTFLVSEAPPGDGA